MNGALLGSGAYITNAGRFGRALYLDGSGSNTMNNIVRIASKVVDTSVSSSWTLGYWIKTTTAGAVIMYQGDGGWSSSGQTTYLLNGNSGSTPGTKAGAVRWAGGFLTGTTTLNDGNWHFISLVDNAGSEFIYVDGNLDTTTSTMTLALASGTDETWIGGSPDTDAGAVKITGFIDEVCMFDRALTQAQIRALYTNAPTTGSLPPASAVSVASGATLILSSNSPTIASLADLNGGGGSVTNGSAVPITLTLGGNVGTATFSGVIADSSAANAVSLVKNGSATEVFAGAYNFRGPTTVNNGTLIINGAHGTNSINVVNGTLGGNGLVRGAVSVQPSGTLSPGQLGVGTLTISNTLALAGTTYIELNQAAATNDNVTGLTSVNYGGTLSLVNLAGTLTTNDAFKIFSSMSYSGAFASITPPIPAPGFAWDGSTLTSDGTLRVLQTVNLAPANISTLVNSGTLTLSWPADHIGWRLQTQTNDLVTGLNTNWLDVPGSTLTNSMNFLLDATLGNVFYRMIFP
jgi:autotransporter-associated beta strand protein